MMNMKKMLQDTHSVAHGYGYAQIIADHLHAHGMGVKILNPAQIEALVNELRDNNNNKLLCSAVARIADEDLKRINGYLCNPTYRARLRLMWDKSMRTMAANSGGWHARWYQKLVIKSTLDAVRALRAVINQRHGVVTLNPVTTTRRPPHSRQRGASSRASAKSGDGNSDGSSSDPDPDDRFVIDPAKNHPLLNNPEYNTPHFRYIRKGIQALRQPDENAACNFYINYLLHELKNKLRAQIYSLGVDTKALEDLIYNAAHSLATELKEEHNFDESPNPLLYRLVKNNIKVPSNLREVANRIHPKHADAIDILNVGAGLHRSERIQRIVQSRHEEGEGDYDGYNYDSLDSFEVTAAGSTGLTDPLDILLAAENDAEQSSMVYPDYVLQLSRVKKLDDMLVWLNALPQVLLDNLIQAHRSGELNMLSCIAELCGYQTNNLYKMLKTRVSSSKQCNYEVISQRLLDLRGVTA